MRFNPLLLLAFLLISVFSSAQTVKVEGRIILAESDDILGSLTVLSLPDSTLMKGSYVDSTYFSVSFDSHGQSNFLLKLKVFNYQDTLLSFSVSDTLISMGELTLTPTLLEEVEASYRKPMYERTMDGITVNVDGTNLQTLSNLFEVLKASPKINSPDNETIQIMGKGTPLILIDKQAIISMDELRAVPASQIQRIEIITNPSAKYRAQSRGGGVIEVYTKNFHLEGYNMTVSLDGGINTQKNPSAGLSLGLSVKKKKFSFNANLGGSLRRNLSQSTTLATTSDGSERSYNSNYRGESWWSWHNLNLKSSYTINEQQSLTAGLRSFGGLGGDDMQNSTQYSELGSPLSQQDQSTQLDYVWLNNTAFLKYTLKTDTSGSSLDINVNYLLKINDARTRTESTFENAVNGSSSQFTRKNTSVDRPNIGEMNIDYEHVFDTSGWKLNVGGAYSILRNGKSLDQYQQFGEEWVIDPLYTNSYDYQEQVAGVYAEVGKMWKVIGFRVGIRGEYTYLNGYSNSLQKKFIDSSYLLPFPSASLLLKPNDKLSFTLSYQSGINRPSFNKYDPFVRIVDSLSIEFGNPYLKPEREQSIGLEIDLFGRYNIGFRYSDKRNPFSTISLINASSFLVSSTPWNARSVQDLTFEFGVPIEAKWVKGWTSIWGSYSKYIFGPEFKRSPFLSLNYGLYSRLTFILPKKIELTNSLHLSQYATDDFVVKPQVYWDLRFTKKFKDSDFQIYLNIGNIVPQKTRTTAYSGNFQVYTESQFNFTTFQLGIFYKFGKLKQAANILDSESSQSGRI